MARDEVFYIGEPVAAVAADDETIAQEAVELIRVEYQDLDIVVEPLQALEPDAPLVHPDLPSFTGFGFAVGGNNCTMLDADRGDVDAAFQQADRIFEETTNPRPSTRDFWSPWPAWPTRKPTAV